MKLTPLLLTAFVSLASARRLADPRQVIPPEVQKVIDTIQSHRRMRTVCELTTLGVTGCGECIDNQIICTDSNTTNTITYDSTGNQIVSQEICTSSAADGFTTNCIQYSPTFQGTCTITFNGQACNSCEWCTDTFGLDADCSNLIPGSSPATCALFVPGAGPVESLFLGNVPTTGAPATTTMSQANPTTTMSQANPTIATAPSTTTMAMPGATTTTTDVFDTCDAFESGVAGFQCQCNRATFTLSCTVPDEQGSSTSEGSFELTFDDQFKDIVAGKFCSSDGEDAGNGYTGACIAYTFAEDETPDTCEISFQKRNGGEDTCEKCEYCVTNGEVTGVDISCNRAGGGRVTCDGSTFSPLAPNGGLFSQLNASDGSVAMSLSSWTVWMATATAVVGALVM